MRINESNRYTPVQQTELPGAYRGEREADSSDAAADADPTAPQDVVTISAENKRGIEGESLTDQQQAAKQETDEMNRLLKSAEAQAAEEKESAEVRRKCLIIAGRIIAGDEVPRKDHRYLAKHDLGLYCRAICMRIVREKARRRRAISDDESANSNEGSSVDSFGNAENRPLDTGEISNLSSGQTTPSVQSDGTASPV